MRHDGTTPHVACSRSYSRLFATKMRIDDTQRVSLIKLVIRRNQYSGFDSAMTQSLDMLYRFWVISDIDWCWSFSSSQGHIHIFSIEIISFFLTLSPRNILSDIIETTSIAREICHCTRVRAGARRKDNKCSLIRVINQFLVSISSKKSFCH
jgi:hypothetical protein